MREPKVFRPLYIPKALQKELPYRDKPKNRHDAAPSVESQRIAVVRESHEQKVCERYSEGYISYLTASH